MTDLDLTLTPAQWEHWDRHGWTLTVAPTEPSTDPTSAMLRAEHAHGRSLSSIARACGITRERVRQLVTATAPVPATVPCPECNGSGQARIGDLMAYLPPCRHCDGSGVVPRTVGIIRPEQVCPACGGMRDVAAADEPNPMPCARCKGLGHFPAERVGIATVTPVPVVPWILGGDDADPPYARAGDLPPVHRWGKTYEEVCGVAALFPTPPNPGTTVWRLDRNEER